jgi:hypothetical protein
MRLEDGKTVSDCGINKEAIIDLITPVQTIQISKG